MRDLLPSIPVPALLIIASVTAAAQACSLSPTVEPATATSAPAPTLPPPTQPSLPTEPTRTTLTLTNRSGETVCYVYISAVTRQDWGQDWLDAAERVPDGASRPFDVEPGEWDLRAEDCNGILISETYAEAVTGAGWEWVLPPRPQLPSGPATLRIVNELTVDICSVRISVSSDPYWGEDWLGADVIVPEGRHEFPVPPGEVYDLRVEDCRGQVLQEEYATAITSDLTVWTVTGP
jgi:hypothetical protein